MFQSLKNTLQEDVLSYNIIQTVIKLDLKHSGVNVFTHFLAELGTLSDLLMNIESSSFIH